MHKKFQRDILPEYATLITEFNLRTIKIKPIFMLCFFSANSSIPRAPSTETYPQLFFKKRTSEKVRLLAHPGNTKSQLAFYPGNSKSH